ncbi:M20 family metallopeptidase [Staphylococcus simulans]|uniref:M20 metallopeptidase family protein n=1 Tax=Staphylococcus simulans TaxID=1286 RepID=UPI000D02602E|nr:M20 family metallopeptidase [Staphylococcus simulans]MDT4012722.1 M20 family metallopeptidase [Staphylococcus simulans]MDU0419644.1 M20 family metallopeptidase [Staphylococcus simulans]MDU0466758.1 M20 family metallopeptidase [Staphylococcus simulans]PTJ02001.1 amidohydrolase [Staphylococcus simulans]PTJ15337.1 amidohydrolase [Staphylococcus simulans]
MTQTELEFVTQHRRHLHQNPELSLEEYETTNHIIAFLESIGVPYERPLETGVVAHLKGNGNHTIAFRADIDALPIDEENDIDFKSSKANVMHACGHDGHTTALLLFVRRCKALFDKGELPQNVVFIFQPAEETGAGANRLIKAGAFDHHPIEAVFGIHVMPFNDEGTVTIMNEEITASATEYRFFLKGQSSHVANKEQGRSCGEGLIHVLNQVSQIQQYHLNGLQRNIVHIGRFNAGEAINTVPSQGYLEGTIRTYDTNDLQAVKDQMSKIAQSVQLLFGVNCEVKFEEGYPPTFNDPTLHDGVVKALKDTDFNVVELEKPYLFGEDFSFYSQIAPSYFAFVGIRNEANDWVHGLHTPKLNFDEAQLIRIADYYENLLFQYGKEVSS